KTYYPTLSAGTGLGNSDLKGSLVDLLNSLGIGLNLKIQETGSTTEQTISWADLKKGSWKLQFGSNMPVRGNTNFPPPTGCKTVNIYDCQYKRSATITLHLFVAENYPQNSIINIISPQSSVLHILTDQAGLPGEPAGTSGFTIKILQPGLTVISAITPQVVSLGHFIKTDEASLTRSGKFSVTVAQKNLPAPGQTFDLPLNITFGSGSLSVIDDTHLALKNTGDADYNGMQLSVRDTDHGNGLINFNQETHMGQLTVTPLIATGQYTGHYAIEVSRRPDMEVKTGKFSGAIPVTITYS
ncbi:TPA: hypothetical protein G8W61_005440, partial [Salmonella enterica]|nr:hypothetical protein [Salmonella enterica]